ncbi:MAG TPA: hypothetical protein VJ768_04350, partial [Anaerolineales bacterium]|nr:hypothetical protein [Anaerolineales bacterium]
MRHSPIVIRTAITFLILALGVVSACSPQEIGPTVVDTETLPAPTDAILHPTATITSAPTPAVSAEPGAASATLDVSGVAAGVTSQVVEAVPPSPDAPWWEAVPQHTLLTLQGYPIAGHLMQPQIFIYPVEGLNENEFAGSEVDRLATWLQNQQTGESMPYLPLYNAAQVFHAQSKILDFKNGGGVRFLTQYDQAPLPINNHELHYTFQGLTSDGKYYVAVVLPVTLPALPADETVTEDQAPDFISKFPTYLTETVDMLNQQPDGAFMPDMSALDSMI